MNRKKVFIVFILCIFISVTQKAVGSVSENVENFANNLGRDLSAPIRSPGLVYTLVGSGVTLATYPLKFTSFQQNIAESKPLGSLSPVGYQLGFWYINAAYTGIFLGYGYILDDEIARTRGWLMVRATAYTALITTGLKELHLEERPRHNGDFASFPSGHASNVFAFAGVVARNHGLGWGIPAFGVAGLVSFSRLNDNGHYLHDVVFAGTIGLAYAFGLDTQWNSADKKVSVAVVPMIDPNIFGIGAVTQF